MKMARMLRILLVTVGAFVFLFLIVPAAVFVYYVGGFGPWEPVEVALPEGLGQITFSRVVTHPYFAEYDRRVEIRLSDGRRLRSDLMTNTGGRTRMFFHWQPAWNRLGPFLLLEDHHGVTWISLKDLCLEDSNKPTVAILPENICPSDLLPVSLQWKYLGKVEYGEDGLQFIAGEHWPPDGVEIDWQLWPPVSLPDERWSFEAIGRYSAQVSSRQKEWLVLRKEGVGRLYAPIKEDEFGTHKASLHWYPSNDSQGPYLRIGPEDGTLVDLGGRRVFHIHKADSYRRSTDPPHIRNAIGMAPFSSVERTRVTYNLKQDRFRIINEDGTERPLLPVPDAVKRNPGIYLGTLHLDPMGFRPASRGPRD